MICPVIWVASTCARGPTIPQNDYWFYFDNIVHEAEFSTNPGDWLARHNNHLLTGAYVVYAVNLVLTDGSSRGLALFSWGCGLAVLAVLGIWAQRTAGRSEAAALGLLVAASWFVFSPLLAMFWFMGFSGVHTLGSVALCLVAIHLWDGYRRGRRPVPLLACLAAAAAALTLFSSTLPLLLVLATAAIIDLRRDQRRLVPFLLLLTVAFVLWLTGYEAQPPSPHTAAGAGSLVLFPFAFVGGALTRAIEPAIVAGLLAAVMAVILAVHRSRHSGDDRPAEDTCWWMLLGFAGGNALLTAVARSPMGLEAAFASRYSVFPVLVWIALGALVANAAHGTGPRRAAVLVACALAVASQLNGRPYHLALERRAQLEPALREAVRVGVEDLQAVNGVVTPWAGAFVHAVPSLRAHGWIPFDDLTPPARHLEPPPVALPRPPKITIWAERTFDGTAYRVAGTLDAALDLGSSLSIVDRSGEVLGRAAMVPGPDEKGGRTSRQFIGYLRVSSPGQVFVSAPSGELVGRFRCCDPDRPLARDVNPFKSPYPKWFKAGTHRSQWLQRALAPR